MAWQLQEALDYYKSQGAPRDQNVTILLLKEIQQEQGGGIPQAMLPQVARELDVKESLLLALIRRIPSLRLSEGHLLELCAGPNCGKHRALADYAETLRSQGITVKFVPCMRMCAKGPNIRWDGALYQGADKSLLDSLIRKK